MADIEVQYSEVDKSNVKKPNFIKIILICIVSILVLIAVGCTIWTSKSYKPQELAEVSLKSDQNIIVEDSNNITFKPANKETTKGFIFYPGGGVKPEAYAPLCREIASKGYKVVIAKMPLNLAVLLPNKADKIIEQNNDIKTWAIGGHSLGGVMASKYASENKDIKGVAFYASYPSGDELKNLDVDVISLYGDKDGVVNKENLSESKDNLPKDTTFVEIDGGNHSQFGDYGLQDGDNKSTIDEKEQFNIAAKYTVGLLNQIK